MIIEAAGWALVVLVCPPVGKPSLCQEQLVTGYVYSSEAGCDVERRDFSILAARCEEITGISRPDKDDNALLGDYEVSE